ncbi:hypothetical protein KTH71_03385 [Acinetobacter sp. WU_MDCI_Axc73]|nr:hypothetical protein [Acinetobacter sp. WU_MDCI_Axc73]
MTNQNDQKNLEVDSDRLQANKIKANELDVNILENDEFSSQQLEGLTDSAELDEEFKQEKKIMKSKQDIHPLHEQSDTAQDDSQGNQAIREAVEKIDAEQLEENLKDHHPEHPSPNPAPFISRDKKK